MGVFDKEIRLINSIQNEVLEVTIATIKRFDFVLIDYNVNKQLDQKGEDSEGNPLGKYSPGYARIRVKRGLQIDHVDTHFTGQFHATITIEIGNDGFSIKSSIDYANDLVKRYGSKILGIQQQYMEEFTEKYLLPQIKTMINDKLAKSSS